MSPVPTLYAHRGASAECPENTIPSFRRALEIGANALEMDVHLSLDGHVIVSHDPTGARMCGKDTAFRHATVAEIKSWDAGAGFVDAQNQRPFAGKNVQIPTLDEVLEEFPNVWLNIDLKQFVPSMVPQTLKTLRRHQAEERVIVASFRWLTLVEAKVRGFRGMTSLTRPEVLALCTSKALFRALPFTGRAAQLPLESGPFHLASRKIIDRCHSLGMRVDYWTVNDIAIARELLALGADGIMTDDPRAILPAFH
jgi:glycerophosphoryl diester phosphodiesterase